MLVGVRVGLIRAELKTEFFMTIARGCIFQAEENVIVKILKGEHG